MGPLCYGWEIDRGGHLGCIIPDGTGGHVFVRYNDDTKGLPADLLGRIQKLEAWAADRRCRPLLLQVKRLLDEEVQQYSLGYSEDGSTIQLDFLNKASIT
jgi:hypothetical protein